MPPEAPAMTATTDALGRPADASRWALPLNWPHLLLIAVCVLHFLASPLLVGLHYGLGWDETVYLSQFNTTVPAGTFTAPRARGVPLLVAPVTLLTASTAAARLYLALVSSVLMYVAFRPWRRLVDERAVPLAALLFSSLWVTVYYGFQAMPNLYVALAAVPAAALVPLWFRERRTSQLVWLAVCVAAAALLRPSDGLYLGGALGLVALLTAGQRWRDRLLVGATCAAGFVGGALQWVVEAYTRYGGPVERYHDALAQQGGTGLHFSLPLHARTLAGPILCREGCHPQSPISAMLWWFVIPPLVVAAFALARREWRLPLATATVVGLLSAAQYVFGIWYSAPRFLLPAYALMALPCAAALVALVARLSGRARTAGLVAVVVLVAGHALSQAVILERVVLPPDNRDRRMWQAQAHALQTRLVQHRPCAIAGLQSQPIAYRVRCKVVTTRQLVSGDVPAGSVRLYLSASTKPPRALADWTRTRIKMKGPKGSVYTYTPPGTSLPR
jgi:4-amino-4-deoxy-L-arabinose transferase-like glycosyltransferase